jgi:transaldolase
MFLAASLLPCGPTLTTFLFNALLFLPSPLSSLPSHPPRKKQMSESASKKQKTTATQFEQLAACTTIVADTGKIDQIKKFQPTDATTNPSLILQAANLPEYAELVKNAALYGKTNGGEDINDQLSLAIDNVCVAFGTEISKVIPGYVSTEVDARLSFDVEQSVRRAKRIIEMYEANGVGRDRVLIKLATTWEGIQAAKILKKEGIECNMTLLFSMAQAVAAAEEDVKLISPFVGRIRDWWMKSSGRSEVYSAQEDPGVLSVHAIYNYYKTHGYNTIVMGASFRSIGEVQMLAGCDRLTIAPKWLEMLQTSTEPLPVQLSAETAASKCDLPKMDVDEAKFRWMMNEDAMATEKLAEGIRKFSVDIVKLENILRELMN